MKTLALAALLLLPGCMHEGTKFAGALYIGKRLGAGIEFPIGRARPGIAITWSAVAPDADVGELPYAEK